MARVGGRVNLENIPTDHDNVAGWEFFGFKKIFFLLNILIVCIPFPEHHRVIELLVMIQ